MGTVLLISSKAEGSQQPEAALVHTQNTWTGARVHARTLTHMPSHIITLRMQSGGGIQWKRGR